MFAVMDMFMEMFEMVRDLLSSMFPGMPMMM